MKHLSLWTSSFIFLTLLVSAAPAGAERIREEGSGPSAQERHNALLSKLDTLSQKQDQILQEINSLKAELNVIKVRASLKS